MVLSWSASEWTWLSMGCRTLRAVALQLLSPLTWHVRDSGTEAALSVLRWSVSEGHCPSLYPWVLLHPSVCPPSWVPCPLRAHWKPKPVPLAFSGVRIRGTVQSSAKRSSFPPLHLAKV